MIYTKPDVACLHKKIVDEVICGGNDPLKGYLDIEGIKVAKECGVDDNSGYGFLSENYNFKREIENAGLIFIGPKPDVIRKNGNKKHS